MELELAQDFKELLKLFNENKVKYMLIGGYAVSIHGFVRATNDIDLVISSDPGNANNVEDLYANKAGVGRSQDLTDIERLKERN